MTAPARVLLADPPWQHDDALGKRGAAANYRCMAVDEIARYRLPPLAADCLLLLWRLSSMQEEALFVAKAWGFKVKSEIVWDKLTSTGKPFFGLGRYVRASHETCLVATRGRVKVANRGIRSRFAEAVTEHSRKPVGMYEIAEALVPGGPYAELFARRRRKGWLCIGDELQATRKRGGQPVDVRQLKLAEGW
jgi:N6-adenosine-specific RNA methylase IME4